MIDPLLVTPNIKIYRDQPLNLDICIYNGRDQDIDVEVELPLTNLEGENDFVADYIPLVRSIQFGRLKPQASSIKSMPLLLLKTGLCTIKQALLRDRLSGDQCQLSHVLDLNVCIDSNNQIVDST